MQALTEALWLDQRFGGLLITHNVEEADASEHVLVMEGGRFTLDLCVGLLRPRAHLLVRRIG